MPRYGLLRFARNDGVGCFHVIASEAKRSSFLAAADFAFDLDHGALCPYSLLIPASAINFPHFALSL
jgi:hypothetical protein